MSGLCDCGHLEIDHSIVDESRPQIVMCQHRGWNFAVCRCPSFRPAQTPWGESYADLAEAILADKSAPPVLAIAAFLYRRGEQGRLRGLIREAIRV